MFLIGKDLQLSRGLFGFGYLVDLLIFESSLQSCKIIKKQNIIMLEKDAKKINDELKKLINHQLLTEFRDHELKPVDSVESINFLKIEIDDDNQDRNKIIVREFIASVRVNILFDNDGSTSTLNTQVQNNTPIEFIVNHEIDQLEMIESTVKLIEQRLS